ncbi:MAG: TonB-dependent receptor [Sulfurimonas sp. RIFCSPHIGHO2_12_FULL_36_9]|uniref:TonB-dependent receptor n=1 Tax=Sulfurimonas sp. RIFCSPLOWO2_12_36_12 TaxID=1802253 RepID=UPI0008C528A4|nr:TonB-dependent receptor [Sulfurimonas sp. RIFCSPLOWO2_12_36_12]OHD99755.1 MAG: TonB-dependent receptor [Sulfurimonas sp. RIFCSPHIGHO2_12_FULL_36_9]OHE01007.1 MAG: TonB-dependent receptor [Sulfurimonas sp. RIFCSPLOWO2_12_36_12]OHE04589.1 MAG: TonB-dependent receptor [Sulfurimonas sp. RIFCSPLOWO2_12_FULL_36_74]
MHKKKILLSLLASTALVAQNIELEPLSITSTAIRTNELRSTDAVEVYTAEDIEMAHVQNIYEFLNSQTSVITMPSYGNSFSQKLDFRGYGIGDGYQNIVITIDGRKINNIDMVPPLLSAISPASIEKMEIIKSGGIVKSGDGANAGVINITTKQTTSKEITVYMGTYGTADGSFYLGHNDEKLSLSASGEAQKSDGIRNINSSGERDESSMTTGTFNITYLPTDELELRAGASFARTNLIYASFLTLDEYNNNPKQAGATNWGSNEQEYDTDALSAGASYYFSDKLSLNVDMNREEKMSNYVTYASVTDYVYNSVRAALKYDSKCIAITAGVDGFEGNLVNTNNDLTKRNGALFLASELYLGKNTLKVGYRYEDISFESKTGEDQKDKLHGVELGYNYTFDKESSVFANYSHSFQSSSLDRLFKWNTGAFMGYVKPSQAHNYTLGYNHITNSNKLKISLFYIDLQDEIYYYADAANWWANARNTNIDKSHKYGLDIYDKWLISDEFNVALNYNFVKAKIDDEIENGEDYSGNDLPGVSDHNIKATLSYLANKNTTLAITQVYRSEAYAADDFNNNFTQKQDAYKSTDISITYTKDNLELFAKINNLFNQRNGLWVQDDAIYPANFTTTAIAGFKLRF